jgi:hypothetical protein
MFPKKCHILVIGRDTEFGAGAGYTIYLRFS